MFELKKKENIFSRTISLFLVILLLFSIFPTGVFNLQSFAATTDSGQLQLSKGGYKNRYKCFDIYYAKNKVIPGYKAGLVYQTQNKRWYGAGDYSQRNYNSGIVEKVITANTSDKVIDQKAVPIYRLWRASGWSTDVESVNAYALNEDTDLNKFAKALKTHANNTINNQKVNTVKYTDTTAKMVALVLRNGCRQHVQNSVYANQLCYLATQILIWEIQEGKRKDNNWGTGSSSYKSINTSKWNLKDPDYWKSYWYNKIYNADSTCKCKSLGYPDYYKMILDACASSYEPKVSYRRDSDNKVVTGAMNKSLLTYNKSAKSKVVKMTESTSTPNYWSATVTFKDGYSDTYNYESSMLGTRFIGWDTIYATDYTDENCKATQEMRIYNVPLLAYIYANPTDRLKATLDNRFLNDTNNYWKISSGTTFTIIGKTINHTMYYVRNKDGSKHGYIYYGSNSTKNYGLGKTFEKVDNAKISFDFEADWKNRSGSSVTFHTTKPTIPTDNSDTKLISYNFVRTGYNKLFYYTGTNITQQGFVSGGQTKANVRYLNFVAKNSFEVAVSGVSTKTISTQQKEITVTFKNNSKIKATVPYKVKVSLSGNNAVQYWDATNKIFLHRGLNDTTDYLNMAGSTVRSSGNKIVKELTGNVTLKELGKATFKFNIVAPITSKTSNYADGDIFGYQGIKIDAYINGGSTGKNNSRKYIEGTNNYRLTHDNKNGNKVSWYKNNDKSKSLDIGKSVEIINYSVRLTPDSQSTTNDKATIKAIVRKNSVDDNKKTVYLKLYKQFAGSNSWAYAGSEYDKTLSFETNVVEKQITLKQVESQFPKETDTSSTVNYLVVVNGTINNNGEYIHNTSCLNELTYTDNTDTCNVIYSKVIENEQPDVKIDVQTDQDKVEAGSQVTGTVTITNLSGKVIEFEDGMPWLLTTLSQSEIAALEDTIEIVPEPEEEEPDIDDDGFEEDTEPDENEPGEDNNESGFEENVNPDNNNPEEDDDTGFEDIGDPEEDDNGSEDDNTGIDEDTEPQDEDPDEENTNANIVASGIVGDEEDLAVGKSVTYTFTYVAQKSGNVTFTAIVNGGNNTTATNKSRYTTRVIEENNYNNNISSKSVEIYDLVDLGIELYASSNCYNESVYVVALLSAKNYTNLTQNPYVRIATNNENLSLKNGFRQNNVLSNVYYSYYTEAKEILSQVENIDISKVSFPTVSITNPTLSKDELSFMADREKLISSEYVAYCFELTSTGTAENELDVRSITGTINLNAPIILSGPDDDSENKYDFNYTDTVKYNLYDYSQEVFNYSSPQSRSNTKMYECYDYENDMHSYDNNIFELNFYPEKKFARLNVINAAGDSITNDFDWSIMASATEYSTENGQGWVLDDDGLFYKYRIDLEPKTMYTISFPNFNGIERFSNKIVGDINISYYDAEDNKATKTCVDGSSVSFTTGSNENVAFVEITVPEDPYNQLGDIEVGSDGKVPAYCYESIRQVATVFQGMALRTPNMQIILDNLDNMYGITAAGVKLIKNSKDSIKNSNSIYYTSEWYSGYDNNISVKRFGKTLGKNDPRVTSIKFYSDSPDDKLKYVDYENNEIRGTNFGTLDEEELWQNDETKLTLDINNLQQNRFLQISSCIANTTYVLKFDGVSADDLKQFLSQNNIGVVSGTVGSTDSENNITDCFKNLSELTNNINNDSDGNACLKLKANAKGNLYFCFNNAAILTTNETSVESTLNKISIYIENHLVLNTNDIEHWKIPEDVNYTSSGHPENVFLELSSCCSNANYVLKFDGVSADDLKQFFSQNNIGVVSGTLKDAENDCHITECFEKNSDFVNNITNDSDGNACLKLKTVAAGNLYLRFNDIENINAHAADINDILNNISLYQKDNYTSYAEGEYDLSEKDIEKRYSNNQGTYSDVSWGYFSLKFPDGCDAVEITVAVGDLKPLNVELLVEGESFYSSKQAGIQDTLSSITSNKTGLIDNALGMWSLQYKPNGSSSYSSTVRAQPKSGVLYFAHVPDGEIKLYSYTLEKVVPYQRNFVYYPSSQTSSISYNLEKNEFAKSLDNTITPKSVRWNQKTISGEYKLDSSNKTNNEPNHLALLFRPLCDYTVKNVEISYVHGKTQLKATVTDKSLFSFENSAQLFDKEFRFYDIAETDTSGKKPTGKYLVNNNITVRCNKTSSEGQQELIFTSPLLSIDYSSSSHWYRWCFEINHPEISNYTDDFSTRVSKFNTDYNNIKTTPWNAWSYLKGEKLVDNNSNIPFEDKYADNYAYVNDYYNNRNATLYVNSVADSKTDVIGKYSLYQVLKDGSIKKLPATSGNTDRYKFNIYPGRYIITSQGYFDANDNTPTATRMPASSWYWSGAKNAKLKGASFLSGACLLSDGENEEQVNSIYNSLRNPQSTDGDNYKLISVDSNFGFINDSTEYRCSPIIEFECFGSSSVLTLNIEYEKVHSISTDIEVVANNIEEDDTIDVAYTIKNNFRNTTEDCVVAQMYAGNKKLSFSKNPETDEVVDYFVVPLAAKGKEGDTVTGTVTIQDVSSLGQGIIPISIEVNCPDILTASGFSKFEKLLDTNTEIKNSRKLSCYCLSGVGGRTGKIFEMNKYNDWLPFEYTYVDNRAQTSIEISQPKLSLEILNTQGQYIAGREVVTTCRVTNDSNAIYFEKAKLIGKLTATNPNGDKVTVLTKEENDNKFVVIPAADEDGPGSNIFWFKWTVPEEWNNTGKDTSSVDIDLRAEILTLSEESVGASNNINVDINEELRKSDEFMASGELSADSGYDAWLKEYKRTGNAKNAYSRYALFYQKPIQLLPNTTYVIKNNPKNPDDFDITTDPRHGGGALQIKIGYDDLPAEIYMDFSGESASIDQTVVFTTDRSGIIFLRFYDYEYPMPEDYSDDYELYEEELNEWVTFDYSLDCLLDSNKIITVSSLSNVAEVERSVYSKYSIRTADTVYEKSMPLDSLYDNSRNGIPEALSVTDSIDRMLTNSDYKTKSALAESGTLASWQNWVEEDGELKIKDYSISKNRNLISLYLNNERIGFKNEDKWGYYKIGYMRFPIRLNSNTSYTLNLPNIDRFAEEYTVSYGIGSSDSINVIYSATNSNKKNKTISFITGSGDDNYVFYLLVKDNNIVLHLDEFIEAMSGASLTADTSATSTYNGESDLISLNQGMFDPKNWTKTEYGTTDGFEYNYYFKGIKPNATYKLTVPEYIDQEYVGRYPFFAIYSEQLGNYFNTLADYPYSKLDGEVRIKTVCTKFVRTNKGILYFKTSLANNEENMDKLIEVLNNSTLEEVGKLENEVTDDYKNTYKTNAFSVNVNNIYTRDAVDEFEKVHIKSGYGINYEVDLNKVDLFVGGNVSNGMLGNANYSTDGIELNDVGVQVTYPEFAYLSNSNNADMFNVERENNSTNYLYSHKNYNKQATYVNPLTFTHYTPIWLPDGEYTTYATIDSVWTPAGECKITYSNSNVDIDGDLIDNWHIRRYSNVKINNN